MTQKQCSQCKEIKEIQFFTSKGSYKKIDGSIRIKYNSKCKQCESINYFKNKDKISEKHKQYYSKIRESVISERKIQSEIRKQKKPIIIKVTKTHQLCRTCGNTYEITKFPLKLSKQQKDGSIYNIHGLDCNECRKVIEKNRRLSNIDKYTQRDKQYYNNNKQAISERAKEYRSKNKEILRIKNREYYSNREKTDINYRLLKTLRARMNIAIKNDIGRKECRTTELLGANIDIVKNHIEKQFKNGMSWENRSEWHIDHIKPCAMFDLTNIEQQKQCFHYTNLQPLWAKENRIKSDRYENIR